MGWIKSISERFQSDRIDLAGGGERVDIEWASEISFDRFDIYQRSHFRRYEFAQSTLYGDRCGDFACGTGYGTGMLAEKFNTVIGADLNAEVVAEILEGSLMLAAHALMLLGVPFNRVLRRIRDTREQRYGLFRGFYHGVTDEPDDTMAIGACCCAAPAFLAEWWRG